MSSNTAGAPAPVKPPFTLASATTKVRMAEDAWNSRDPERVALAYSEDSQWRNRAEFLAGARRHPRVPAAQVGTRTRLPADQGDLGVRRRTASPCASRTSGTMTRATGSARTATRTGNSMRRGLMRRRHASINDLPISEGERKYHWSAPGARPADHPGLSELGL